MGLTGGTSFIERVAAWVPGALKFFATREEQVDYIARVHTKGVAEPQDNLPTHFIIDICGVLYSRVMQTLDQVGRTPFVPSEPAPHDPQPPGPTPLQPGAAKRHRRRRKRWDITAPESQARFRKAVVDLFCDELETVKKSLPKGSQVYGVCDHPTHRPAAKVHETVKRYQQKTTGYLAQLKAKGIPLLPPDLPNLVIAELAARNHRVNAQNDNTDFIIILAPDDADALIPRLVDHLGSRPIDPVPAHRIAVEGPDTDLDAARGHESFQYRSYYAGRKKGYAVLDKKLLEKSPGWKWGHWVVVMAAWLAGTDGTGSGVRGLGLANMLLGKFMYVPVSLMDMTKKEEVVKYLMTGEKLSMTEEGTRKFLERAIAWGRVMGRGEYPIRNKEEMVENVERGQLEHRKIILPREGLKRESYVPKMRYGPAKDKDGNFFRKTATDPSTFADDSNNSPDDGKEVEYVDTKESQEEGQDQVMVDMRVEEPAEMDVDEESTTVQQAPTTFLLNPQAPAFVPKNLNPPADPPVETFVPTQNRPTPDSILHSALPNRVLFGTVTLHNLFPPNQELPHFGTPHPTVPFDNYKSPGFDHPRVALPDEVDKLGGRHWRQLEFQSGFQKLPNLHASTRPPWLNDNGERPFEEALNPPSALAYTPQSRRIPPAVSPTVPSQHIPAALPAHPPPLDTLTPAARDQHRRESARPCHGEGVQTVIAKGDFIPEYFSGPFWDATEHKNPPKHHGRPYYAGGKPRPGFSKTGEWVGLKKGKKGGNDADEGWDDDSDDDNFVLGEDGDDDASEGEEEEEKSEKGEGVGEDGDDEIDEEEMFGAEGGEEEREEENEEDRSDDGDARMEEDEVEGLAKEEEERRPETADQKQRRLRKEQQKQHRDDKKAPTAAELRRKQKEHDEASDGEDDDYDGDPEDKPRKKDTASNSIDKLEHLFCYETITLPLNNSTFVVSTDPTDPRGCRDSGVNVFRGEENYAPPNPGTPADPSQNAPASFSPLPALLKAVYFSFVPTLTTTFSTAIQRVIRRHQEETGSCYSDRLSTRAKTKTLLKLLWKGLRGDVLEKVRAKEPRTLEKAKFDCARWHAGPFGWEGEEQADREDDFNTRWTAATATEEAQTFLREETDLDLVSLEVILELRNEPTFIPIPSYAKSYFYNTITDKLSCNLHNSATQILSTVIRKASNNHFLPHNAPPLGDTKLDTQINTIIADFLYTYMYHSTIPSRTARLPPSEEDHNGALTRAPWQVARNVVAGRARDEPISNELERAWEVLKDEIEKLDLDKIEMEAAESRLGWAMIRGSTLLLEGVYRGRSWSGEEEEGGGVPVEAAMEVEEGEEGEHEVEEEEKDVNDREKRLQRWRKKRVETFEKEEGEKVKTARLNQTFMACSCGPNGWLASDGGVKGTIIRCSQCHEYHHLDCINRIRQQAGQDVLPVNTNFACYECITDKTRRPRSLGTVVESAQTLAQIKWAGESHLYDNQMATTGDLFNLVHSLKLLAGSAQGIEINYNPTYLPMPLPAFGYVLAQPVEVATSALATISTMLKNGTFDKTPNVKKGLLDELTLATSASVTRCQIDNSEALELDNGWKWKALEERHNIRTSMGNVQPSHLSDKNGFSLMAAMLNRKRSPKSQDVNGSLTYKHHILSAYFEFSPSQIRCGAFNTKRIQSGARVGKALKGPDAGILIEQLDLATVDLSLVAMKAVQKSSDVRYNTQDNGKVAFVTEWCLDDTTKVWSTCTRPNLFPKRITKLATEPSLLKDIICARTPTETKFRIISWKERNPKTKGGLPISWLRAFQPEQRLEMLTHGLGEEGSIGWRAAEEVWLKGGDRAILFKNELERRVIEKKKEEKIETNQPITSSEIANVLTLDEIKAILLVCIFLAMDVGLTNYVSIVLIAFNKLSQIAERRREFKSKELAEIVKEKHRVQRQLDKLIAEIKNDHPLPELDDDLPTPLASYASNKPTPASRGRATLKIQSSLKQVQKELNELDRREQKVIDKLCYEMKEVGGALSFEERDAPPANESRWKDVTESYHLKQRPIFFLVGDGFEGSNPTYGVHAADSANRIVRKLAKSFRDDCGNSKIGAAAKPKFLEVVVDEYLSSQKCADPNCLRDDGSRSNLITARYGDSGAPDHRAQQCDKCGRPDGRDGAAATVILQIFLHFMKFGLHLFRHVV